MRLALRHIALALYSPRCAALGRAVYQSNRYYFHVADRIRGQALQRSGIVLLRSLYPLAVPSVSGVPPVAFRSGLFMPAEGLSD